MVFPMDFGATAVPSGPGRRGAPPRDHAPGPGAEAHGDRAAGGGHGRGCGGQRGAGGRKLPFIDII